MFKINEIFKSIDGEINQWHQGRTCTFIRFSGCNCLCKWCDTDHSSYKEMSINEIFDEIDWLGMSKITITGGEPLIHNNLHILITELVKHYKRVSVETNGTIEIPENILNNVNWLVDIKLPSSGVKALSIKYYKTLPANVYFKFCIADLKDYEVAKKYLRQLAGRTCAFSPIIGQTPNWPTKLAEQIVDDELDVVYNLQIHKYLNVK